MGEAILPRAGGLTKIQYFHPRIAKRAQEYNRKIVRGGNCAVRLCIETSQETGSTTRLCSRSAARIADACVQNCPRVAIQPFLPIEMGETTPTLLPNGLRVSLQHRVHVERPAQLPPFVLIVQLGF